MWKKNGEIIQYVYHMNQPGKYGDEFKWMVTGKPAHFEMDQWNKITTEITLNEPGKKNGIRSWLGEEKLDQRIPQIRKCRHFILECRR